MTDFHQPPGSWQPFEFLIGVGGVLSHWWIPFVAEINWLVGGVTFYGGALLVLVQIWRLCRKWGPK